MYRNMVVARAKRSSRRKVIVTISTQSAGRAEPNVTNHSTVQQDSPIIYML